MAAMPEEQAIAGAIPRYREESGQEMGDVLIFWRIVGPRISDLWTVRGAGFAQPTAA